MTPYIDGDTADEATDAIRQGKSPEVIAGALQMDTEFMGRLLGLPRPTPPDDPSADFDLWAAMDRLDAVL
jgi:hypothetical protein